MNYYISDMHFGHNNVLRFDMRPFESIDEMDRMLITYWNMRVREEDHVYILGDFCYNSKYMPEYYLEKLNGHKHLILGNHDGVIMKRPEAQAYFESIDTILRINDEGRGVVMCHYPIADWEGRSHGTTHIHGHIHGRDLECMKFLQQRGPAYNAAACINNYQPCKLEEIIANNQQYMSRWANTTTLTFKFSEELVKKSGTTIDELLKDMRSYAKECGVEEIYPGVFAKEGNDAMAILIGYAVRKAKSEPEFLNYLESWVANIGGVEEDCKVEMEKQKE